MLCLHTNRSPESSNLRIYDHQIMGTVSERYGPKPIRNSEVMKHEAEQIYVSGGNRNKKGL
jgi:hypothetical protein